MNVVGAASANEWPSQAADASMLLLFAQPGIGSRTAVRQAAAGEQLLSSVMEDPSSDTELASGQLNWLIAHREEAVALLLRVSAADSTFQAWVDYQLTGLHNASELVVAPTEYLAAWASFQRTLGVDGFAELTRSVLKKKTNRNALIGGSQDPTLALAVSEAVSGENYAAELRTWAADIVKNISGADWEAALGSATGAPILDLALHVSSWGDEALNPPGLSDALHSHFQRLADGEAAWQPNADTFAGLTGLLGAAARKPVASQLCAALEGRDGQVGSGLFATYGTFLAGERDFRTHQKLPNFVERAVAHGEWDSVQWIVELATKHPDTLGSKNRKEELEHLKSRVTEKLNEISETGSEPPDALSSLSKLLAND